MILITSFLVLLPLALLTLQRWVSSLLRSSNEPPLVPSKVPWLGHAFFFMKDINGFTDWVRSKYPDAPAVTLQIAGRPLYLILDAKLAGLIFRKSRIFIFDPFSLMVWSIVGATKQDLAIAKVGSQSVKRDSKIDPQTDKRRLLHELHISSTAHLSGDALSELTTRFVKTLCEELDKQFPVGDTEWRTVDLCKFVKSTWTHASIMGLFGPHMFEVWPEIADWLWEFDAKFQTIITKMPRFLFPKAYDIRDEGIKKCEQWEADAWKAEAEGKSTGDALWDPYWGHCMNSRRSHKLVEYGISSRARGGNSMSLLWGLNANAIPVAMQTIMQAALKPTLLAELQAEITSCQTGPVSFDMDKVTTQPKLRSVLLESLRWATASVSPRVVREDCDLDGYKLKANSMVMVASRTLQREGKTWEIPGEPKSDPANYWPERFLEGDDEFEASRVSENAEAEASYQKDINEQAAEASKKKQPEPLRAAKDKEMKERLLSLRPFGGGTTLCPGRHFATNEILGGLAALMLRLEVEVIEEELQKNGVPEPDPLKQGGLFPDRPMMVRIRRRQLPTDH